MFDHDTSDHSVQGETCSLARSLSKRECLSPIRRFRGVYRVRSRQVTPQAINFRPFMDIASVIATDKLNEIH
jgi:hypothetical protein